MKKIVLILYSLICSCSLAQEASDYQTISPYDQYSYSPTQSTSTTSPQNTPAIPTNTNATAVARPQRSRLGRLGDWVTDKVKGDRSIEEELAEAEIKAGETRLKTIKAKEKLDRHIVDSEQKTRELTADYNQSKQEAEYYDNRVKTLRARL